LAWRYGDDGWSGYTVKLFEFVEHLFKMGFEDWMNLEFMIPTKLHMLIINYEDKKIYIHEYSEIVQGLIHNLNYLL